VNELVAEGGRVLVSDDRSGEETIDKTRRPRLSSEPSAARRVANPLEPIEPEDTFESGSVAGEARAREKLAPRDLDNRRRLMSAFAIHYDGRHYRYNGYRYDRLADAVSYAELMQSRQPRQDDPGSLTHDALVESPSASDRAVMAALSISFSAGVYGYSGFHYDRLADAVTYAQMPRRKHPLGPGT
jgi:hypothetical protein